MALPPQALEQLGRESIRSPGWSSRILMLAGTIFFASIAIYLGVVLGYRPFLVGQLKEVEEEITRLEVQIPPADQEAIITFHSQLLNVRRLLVEQRFPSRVFPLLEENTEVDVYFTKATLDLAKNRLELEGKAKTMDDVVAQLAAFRAVPEVRQVVFEGAARGSDGLWNFSANLSLDKTLYVDTPVSGVVSSSTP